MKLRVAFGPLIVRLDVLEPVNEPVPDIVPLMLKVLPAPMLSILPAGIVRLFMIKSEGKTGIEVLPASMLTSL